MDFDPHLFRALERLLSVLIGGCSIYLGYRLFAAVKATGEGDAHVKLPGDVTVMVSRVAPGVFFALFGAVVVSIALSQSVTSTDTDRTTAGGGSEHVRTLSSVGGHVGSQQAGDAIGIDRLRIRDQIMFLNHLTTTEQASDQETRRIERHARDIKLTLMHSVWGTDWGNEEAFRLWAEGGATAADTDSFRDARRFYESAIPASP